MNWFDPADIQANKGMAWLAYLGIFVLIPLFARSQSRFCRAHTNQGLTLLLVSIAAAIVSTVFFFIHFILGVLFSIVLSSVLSVVAIIKIVQTLQGRYSPLPLAGKISLLK